MGAAVYHFSNGAAEGSLPVVEWTGKEGLGRDFEWNVTLKLSGAEAQIPFTFGDRGSLTHGSLRWMGCLLEHTWPTKAAGAAGARFLRLTLGSPLSLGQQTARSRMDTGLNLMSLIDQYWSTFSNLTWDWSRCEQLALLDPVAMQIQYRRTIYDQTCDLLNEQDMTFAVQRMHPTPLSTWLVRGLSHRGYVPAERVTLSYEPKIGHPIDESTVKGRASFFQYQLQAAWDSREGEAYLGMILWTHGTCFSVGQSVQLDGEAASKLGWPNASVPLQVHSIEHHGPTSHYYYNKLLLLPFGKLHLSSPAPQVPRGLPVLLKATIEEGPLHPQMYSVRFDEDTVEHPLGKASKPIPLLAPMAGKQAGIHFTLLPGTRVLVGFENNSYHHPFIWGCLDARDSALEGGLQATRRHQWVTSQQTALQFEDRVENPSVQLQVQGGQQAIEFQGDQVTIQSHLGDYYVRTDHFAEEIGSNQVLSIGHSFKLMAQKSSQTLLQEDSFCIESHSTRQQTKQCSICVDDLLKMEALCHSDWMVQASFRWETDHFAYRHLSDGVLQWTGQHFTISAKQGSLRAGHAASLQAEEKRLHVKAKKLYLEAPLIRHQFTVDTHRATGLDKVG